MLQAKRTFFSSIARGGVCYDAVGDCGSQGGLYE